MKYDPFFSFLLFYCVRQPVCTLYRVRYSCAAVIVRPSRFRNVFRLLYVLRSRVAREVIPLRYYSCSMNNQEHTQIRRGRRAGNEAHAAYPWSIVFCATRASFSVAAILQQAQIGDMRRLTWKSTHTASTASATACIKCVPEGTRERRAGDKCD